MKGALSHSVYRRLLAAQVFSVLGSGLTTIALGLLAYEISGRHAGAVLGTALAVKMIAYVGLAPVAAALSSRVPRKPFLIALDLGRASLVLLLPFVTETWQIYALVFAFQACSAAFTPTFQATIPDVLPSEEDYTEALSYSRLSYDLEALLSPVIAGAILAVAQFDILFLGTAIGFLVSAALVASSKIGSGTPDETQTGFGERLTKGVRIYFATPRLRGLLALYIGVAAATAMIIVNTVVRVKVDLGYGDQIVALYFAASGSGSIAVALLLPRLLKSYSARRAAFAGAILLIASMAYASTGPGLVAGLLLWALIGAGTSLIQTPSGLLLTKSCSAADRSALFAAHFSLSHAAWLIFYPLAGQLGSLFGLSATFAVMSALTAAGALAAVMLWPPSDPTEIKGGGPTQDPSATPHNR